MILYQLAEIYEDFYHSYGIFSNKDKALEAKAKLITEEMICFDYKDGVDRLYIEEFILDEIKQDFLVNLVTK